MDEALIGVGAVIGMIFGVLIGLGIGQSDTHNVINECELNLPRTQHCVLTAVPAQEQAK